MSHHRSRSPRDRRRNISARENWRTRQERPKQEDYSFARSRRSTRGGPYPWRDLERRRSEGDAPRHPREPPKNEQVDTGSHDASQETVPAETGSFRGRRGYGRRFRGNPRRRSVPEEKEVIKPIVLNPMDVPKADRYFSHDDRLGRGQNGRQFRRSRIDSTPAKWGHDMFDKINNEEEEEGGTPPPDGNEGNIENKTKSIINKVNMSPPVYIFEDIEDHPSIPET